MSSLNKHREIVYSFILCLLYFAHTPVYATLTPHNVVIVHDGKSGTYDKFLRKLEEELGNSKPGLTIKTINLRNANLGKVNDLKDVDIYVSVGTDSAEAIINNHGKKILSLIPESVFIEKYKNKPEICPPATCKALVLDQPITRQLRSLHLLFPAVKSILILTDRNTKSNYSEYRTTAKSLGLNLQIKSVTPPDELVQQLKESLPSSDVLLTTPNGHIYNSNTARAILLTTYKYGVPIFAHTQSFIDAGAVGGIYSTAEQYAQHAAELVMESFSNSGRSNTQVISPKYFTLNANYSVAESLNITIPDLLRAKTQLEKQQ